MSLCALNSFGVSSFQNVQMCNLAHNSQNQRYNLDQFNNTRNFSVIDYSKPGNRLYERPDGSIGIIPKPPAEVLGEVLRPMIDKTISLGKGAFGFISKSFSYLDTRFSKMIQILPGAKATDVGQIGYFEGDCPDGWENYIHGQERFILGAGGGYTLGSTGGEFTHTLTVDEMPSHTHSIQDGGYEVGDGPTIDSAPDAQSHSVRTGAEGGGEAHNNMPPYIALRPCKKLEDSSVDLSSYAKKSDLNPVKDDLSNIKANYALKSDIPSHDNYALKSEIPSLTSYTSKIDFNSVKEKLESKVGEIEDLKKEASSSKSIAIIAAVASGIQFLVGLGVLIWNCATRNAHQTRQQGRQERYNDAQNQRIRNQSE